MEEDTEEEVTLTEDSRVTQRDISSMSERKEFTLKGSLSGSACRRINKGNLHR